MRSVWQKFGLALQKLVIVFAVVSFVYYAARDLVVEPLMAKEAETSCWELVDTCCYEEEKLCVEEVIMDDEEREAGDIESCRDYINMGSVRALDGKICIVQYFISEPDDIWTKSEHDVVTERVFEAEGWLKKEAAKFGNDVEFITCSFGSGEKCYTLDYIPKDSEYDDKDDNLFQKAMRGIGWEDHDAFIERMKEKYECESVLVLLMIKATGRSWAYPYCRMHAEKDNTQRALEGAVIFKDKRYKDGTSAPLKASTVAHEMLHLCGAWDLYYEEGVQDHEHADKAEELFPNSIMIHDSKDIYSKEIDEVTAWLVGLKEMKNWYVWFQPEV